MANSNVAAIYKLGQSERSLASQTGSSSSLPSSAHNSSRCSQLRSVFASLRFVFLALVTSALIIVSVLSWNLTFKAAQHSISLVTNDYSTVLVTQISADISRRLAAAEHVTKLNKGYFRAGILSYSDRTQMLEAFFLQISDLVSDTVSSMSMTTKEGGLNGLGYVFPITSDPYMVHWLTDGGNMTESYIDETTGAVTGFSFEEFNSDSTTSEWYQCANTSDPNSSGWSQPYPWYGAWFMSTSRTLLSPNGTLIGVITADMQLGFIDTIAKDLATSSSVGTQFFILNVETGAILGTSITGFDLTDDSDNSVFLYSDSSPTVLHAIHKFILKQSGRTNVSTAYQGLSNFTGQITVSGARLLVAVRTFTHDTVSGNNVEWVFIHVLDRSSIESEIDDSNLRVLVAVVCICCGFIAATTGLIFYAMRLISNLSVILTAFARFEFRAHVAGGQLKSRSVFTELKEMQNAVLLMTRSFKAHLDGKQAVFGRGGGQHTAPSSQTGGSSLIHPVPPPGGGVGSVGLPIPNGGSRTGSLVGHFSPPTALSTPGGRSRPQPSSSPLTLSPKPRPHHSPVPRLATAGVVIVHHGSERNAASTATLAGAGGEPSTAPPVLTPLSTPPHPQPNDSPPLLDAEVQQVHLPGGTDAE